MISCGTHNQSAACGGHLTTIGLKPLYIASHDILLLWLLLAHVLSNIMANYIQLLEFYGSKTASPLFTIIQAPL